MVQTCLCLHVCFLLTIIIIVIISPTDTHSQIMLLHSLKRANYNLPLVLTDSGFPPLTNNTELKVQVCTCKKNRMDCNRVGSLRTNLLLLLGLLLFSMLCEYATLYSKTGGHFERSLQCILGAKRKAMCRCKEV